MKVSRFALETVLDSLVSSLNESRSYENENSFDKPYPYIYGYLSASVQHNIGILKTMLQQDDMWEE